MPPPPAGRPARRVAAALRALTGRGPRTSALLRTPEEVEPEPAPAVVGAAVPTSGEQAAARIDAARARLRATIAAPDDDGPPVNEKKGP